MRAGFGLLLAMLGLAMAVVWMPDNDSKRQLAVITGVATPQNGASSGGGGNDNALNRGARTFSPGAPLIASVEMPDTRPSQPVTTFANTLASLATAPGTPSTVVRMGHQATAGRMGHQATVARGHRAPTVAAVASSTIITSQPARPREATTASSMSHDELVRNIQRELRRVGCYAGEIDGDWGPGSRRAMTAFTDRVNASLPVYQPDFILLTLLQGRQGEVCNTECPQGQTLSEANRCVPNAIVAQARRSADRIADRRTTAPRDIATATPATEGWTTRMTRATTSTGAASPAGEDMSRVAATASVTTQAVVAAPLPGRMSMGGPQNGGVIIYGAPSTEASLAARDAVRSAQSDVVAEDERPAAQSTAKRTRRTARRGNQPYGYQAPPPRYGFAPTYYRAPRQAYYAPQRRSRSWTANFFGRL